MLRFLARLCRRIAATLGRATDRADKTRAWSLDKDDQ